MKEHHNQIIFIPAESKGITWAFSISIPGIFVPFLAIISFVSLKAIEMWEGSGPREKKLQYILALGLTAAFSIYIYVKI